MWPTLLLSLLIACGNKTAPMPENPPDGAAEQEAPDGENDGAADGEDPNEDGEKPDAETEKPTPQSLYEECFDRVEGRQAEGECTTDEDCVPVGCSKETCVTKAVAEEGAMSTCEDRLCFKVLDTCGCNEGQCSWSLKAEVPEMVAPAKLPPTRLPPTPPPAEGTEPAEDGAEDEADGAEDGTE